MPVYMVERELPGITMDQLEAAQMAAIETSDRLTSEGKNVRYIRTTWIPGDSRAMCMFQADSADLVRKANETTQTPYTRIAEAMDLTPHKGVIVDLERRRLL